MHWMMFSEFRNRQNKNICFSNYYKTAKRDLDIAISYARTFEEFKIILQNMNYTIINRSGKLSIRNNEYNRNIRIERYFGDDYSIENINKQIKGLYNKTDSKNHKQLYHIFKLLPTVNKQFNIPCREIDCDTIEMIDPLSMADVCEVLGYHRTNRSKVWKMLRGFRVEDDYMFCKHEVDAIDFLCINPKLFYAGTQIDNLKCMINVFDMAKNVNNNSKS